MANLVSRACRRALAVAVVLSFAPALAQQPGSPSPEPASDGYREPPVPGAPVAPGAPPAPADAPDGAPADDARPASPVRLVANVGWDIGLEKLIEVGFEDGSTQTLRLNGGGFAAVGVAFLPLLDGRLETRATIGLKGDEISAANGSVSYRAFPLEITESLDLRPLRLAAGASILLAPRVRGRGFLEAYDLDFARSLGFVGQAEWVMQFRGGRGAMSLGLRYVWHELEPKQGGRAVDASALGGVLGFTI